MTATIEASRSSRDVPLIAATVAVVAWGFGPLMVRSLPVSAPSIIVFRLGFAIPVMIAVAYLTGGRMTFAVLRAALLPGVLFALSMMASFESYKSTSIALAALIPALQPALVLVIATRFFGERSSARQFGFAAAAIVGVIGMVLVSDKTSGTAMRGNLYAVVNLLLWTAYFVQVKRIRSTGVHSWSFLASVFTVGACVAIPWGLIVSTDLGKVGGSDWFFIGLMVVGPGLIGHGLMTWAQRHLDLGLASLLTLTSPIISAIGAWIIYHEGLRALQAAFAVLVLAALSGIVIDNRGRMPTQTLLSGPVE